MSRDIFLIRALCVVSFAASLTLSLLLARSRAEAALVLVFAALVGGAWGGVPRLRASWRNAALSLAVLNALVVVPELLLRLRDFRYEPGIQFGYPRPAGFHYLQPDEKLLWRRNPRDKNVNSMGFIGREVEMPKPPHTFRILFFGDSVMEQGLPEIVAHLLNLHRGDSLRVECVSLAVAGYSSYQGTVLVDLYGVALEPDAAVVLFGWNDHYLAYGEPDKAKVITPSTVRRPPALFRSVRLVQCATWAADGLRGRRPRPSGQLRVPPDDYRRNLAYMHDRLHERHVPVVFLTAPTAHYRLDAPDYLVRRGFAQDKPSVMALHARYNGIVREVASERGAMLVDLERELGSLPAPDLASLFSRDGIHLSLAGIAVVASRLAGAIEPLLPG